jgi:hypothetical protein
MLDDTQLQNSTGRLHRLRRWFQAHTAIPILILSTVGLVLAVLLVYGYSVWCWGRQQGICKVIADHPPWLVTTGVAAALPVLLTWYWRTVHKKADCVFRADPIARSGRTRSLIPADPITNSGGPDRPFRATRSLIPEDPITDSAAA